MIFMSSVFLLFILNPASADVVANIVVLSCICLQFARGVQSQDRPVGLEMSSVFRSSFHRKKEERYLQNPYRILVSTINGPCMM
jgi:hypothetical protein